MQPYRHDKLQFLTTRAAMRLLCAIIVELLVFLEVLEGLILLLLDSARMPRLDPLASCKVHLHETTRQKQKQIQY